MAPTPQRSNQGGAASKLRAELYALTHRGHAGDVQFYEQTCRGAASVLELGCGFGRVLSALRKPGRSLVGLDLDEQLLALARAALEDRNVELIAGDMRGFALGRTFERVIIPYSGFYCLPTRRDALACLRAARRHLAPGGVLAFDAYAADGFQGQPAQPEPEVSWIVAIHRQGRAWDVYERSCWYKARQRFNVTYVYRERDTGREMEVDLPQRYWLADQVPDLLAAAGLELRSLHGGFRRQIYDPRKSEVMVVTARAR